MKGKSCDNSEINGRDIVANDKDPAVDFSVNILRAFEEKSKEHNKQNLDSETTPLQLKNIYIRGANSFNAKRDPSGSLNIYGLARVNMHIRHKLGGKISTAPSQEQKSSGMKGLEFEQTPEAPLLDCFLDITSSWEPQQEDFEKAKEDIKTYNLDYSFSNIEDIYLEEYEKMQFNWE